MDEKMLAVIRAETDQDREKCLQWIRNADPSHLAAVWGEIQKDQPTPIKEIVTRFAQLAFCEYVDRVATERGF